MGLNCCLEYTQIKSQRDLQKAKAQECPEADGEQTAGVQRTRKRAGCCHLTVQHASHPYFPQGKMYFSGAIGFIPTAVLSITAKSEAHA